MPQFVAHIKWLRRATTPDTTPENRHRDKVLDSGDTIFPFSAENDDEVTRTLRTVTDPAGSRSGANEYRIVNCWEVARKVPME